MQATQVTPREGSRDDGRLGRHEMFPPQEAWPRYADQIARPVLVLGVDAPGAGHSALHDVMVTRGFHASLPPIVREHLVYRVVDTLVSIAHKHGIEGLVMPGQR